MSDSMFCYVGLCVTYHVMQNFRCLWSFFVKFPFMLEIKDWWCFCVFDGCVLSDFMCDVMTVHVVTCGMLWHVMWDGISCYCQIAFDGMFNALICQVRWYFILLYFMPWCLMVCKVIVWCQMVCFVMWDCVSHTMSFKTFVVFDGCVLSDAMSDGLHVGCHVQCYDSSCGDK
jgi:hypothetical protein